MSAMATDDMRTADVSLQVGSRRLRMRLAVPAGPTPARFALPLMQRLADAAVAAVGEDAAALGTPITCRAGCTACCRHLVPVSRAEAYHLTELIEAMPSPRREEVRARFDAAARRLAETGLLAELADPRPWGEGEWDARPDEYLRLGLDCPFLEAGRCSVYSDRPLVCREYVAISPPEFCHDPRAGQVKVPEVPLNTWKALARAEDGRTAWAPLVLAPRWAAQNPEPAPALTGPELMRRLFAEMTGRAIPAAPPQEPSCPPA